MEDIMKYHRQANEFAVQFLKKKENAFRKSCELIADHPDKVIEKIRQYEERYKRDFKER